jgi:hypothetical protein
MQEHTVSLGEVKAILKKICLNIPKLPVWLLALAAICSCQSGGTFVSPTPLAINPTAPVLNPTSTATSTSLPPTITPTPALGTVRGSVCYPSQENPPIILYLENTVTRALIKLAIPQDRPRYTLTAPPGEYIAYALTVGTELAGTYSKAVPCGLSDICTDHHPLPFQVRGGETTEEIDLCDWYNPPGRVVTMPDASTEAVMVTTVQKMNIFANPGLNYPMIGFAPALASAPALGRNEDGSWLQIKYPSAKGSAWIYAPLVQVAGPVDTLPLVAMTNPTRTIQTKLVASTDQFTPAAWNASNNPGVVHFKGSIKDEQGRPVNGFSILADNGTWSVLSHPTGASHWYPDLTDGAWDIIITNATDAAGWWTLTVVSYDCPDFEAGFNAQCKEFTRLSANQLVQIVYPRETVITADWVCHRDCKKGLYIKAYRP